MSGSTHDDKRRDIVPAATTSLSPRGGAKHRTLKRSILEALAAAGPDGMSADELSAELEVLKVRIQNWFSGTGKRTPGIVKVGEGRWYYKKPRIPPHR